MLMIIMMETTTTRRQKILEIFASPLLGYVVLYMQPKTLWHMQNHPLLKYIPMQHWLHDNHLHPYPVVGGVNGTTVREGRLDGAGTEQSQ